MSFEKQLAVYQNHCEQALVQAAERFFQPGSTVSDAARYALLGGGKRVRGVLVLAVSDMLGGNHDAARAFSAAIEMVHAFSLIHDDLPCMDNDAMRRGKPSVHIAFGEATALLAGDLLALQAFETVVSPPVPPLAAACGAGVLSAAAGARGMLYGQEMDITLGEKQAGEAELDLMQRKKTGALIRGAVALGAVAADREPNAEPAALAYADNLGCCFQIVDDVLDETANEAELGKPVGSDRANHKITYVSLFGLEKAKNTVQRLTCAAVEALAGAYGEKADFLCRYSRQLETRVR